MPARFELCSNFQPAGDQPQAIDKLVAGYGNGRPYQTLMAQLYKEFRAFFPKNAVHYFISYYDYYQPEAYIPQRDIYIEKDAQINENIDRLRLAATSALLSREDVIIVASVSCIYGL